MKTKSIRIVIVVIAVISGVLACVVPFLESAQKVYPDYATTHTRWTDPSDAALGLGLLSGLCFIAWAVSLSKSKDG